MTFSFREFLIWKIITISLLITISTEFLSYFNLINSTSIRIFWGLIITIILAYICLFKKKFSFLEQIIFLKKNFTFELFIVLVILILTLFNSLIYPPNTLDAMAYHMPKIMHWTQNANIEFYPTNDLRQLILAPFSEFIILHLYLFFDTDIFSNFVQWYSMFISVVTISLISKELGCNSKYQIFSILFCSTLPMGILQSTSTQTDYVTAMWLTIMVYFLLKYIKIRSSSNLFSFALALSFGIFTKGTTYIFAFPFCIWLGIYVFIKNKNHLKYLVIIPLIILIINFGHFKRNMSFTGNPLGISNESPSWLNKTFTPQAFTSNLLRNVGLNLSLPNAQINKFTANKISSFLNKFGISTKDPNTTKISHRGYYIPFSFYESTAPNTLHFLIIVFSMLFYFSKKRFNSIQRNYLYSVIFGFLFFSFLLIWTAQHNRLLLSFFILSSPLVSIFLFNFNFKNLTKILSISLIIYSIPYILFNKTRPLVAQLNIDMGLPSFHLPNYLKEEKNELYFVADKIYNNRNLYNYYSQSAKSVKNHDCGQIGFDSGRTNIEYPLWVILKDNFKSKKFELYNVNISNKSKFIKSHKGNLCAILYPDKIDLL